MSLFREMRGKVTRIIRVTFSGKEDLRDVIYDGRVIKKTSCLLFAFYGTLLIYCLFFAKNYGRTDAAHRTYHYNLVLFTEIRRFWEYRKELGFSAMFLNVMGNVLGFVPYGLIVPILFRNTRSICTILISGAGFSFLVECVQLVTKVGCFDVDDILLNTIGVFWGYLLFLFLKKRRGGYFNGKKI